MPLVIHNISGVLLVIFESQGVLVLRREMWVDPLMNSYTLLPLCSVLVAEKQQSLM